MNNQTIILSDNTDISFYRMLTLLFYLRVIRIKSAVGANMVPEITKTYLNAPLDKVISPYSNCLAIRLDFNG